MSSAAERQAAFKAKMRKQGLALVAEWIPETDRARFKAFASELRKAALASKQTPERDTSNVQAAPPPPENDTSNAQAAPPPEPARTRVKAKRPDTPAQGKQTGNKTPHQLRQERYAAQWASSKESLRVVDSNGIEHEARILTRTTRTTKTILEDSVAFTAVEGLIRKGKVYQKLEYSIHKNSGIRHHKPAGWRVVSEADIKRARKRVRELHPDHGGPGGPEFQAAMDELKALRGSSA